MKKNKIISYIASLLIIILAFWGQKEFIAIPLILLCISGVATRYTIKNKKDLLGNTCLWLHITSVIGGLMFFK